MTGLKDPLETLLEMIPFLPKQAFEGEPKTEYEYCPNIDTYNAGRGIFSVGYLEY